MDLRHRKRDEPDAPLDVRLRDEGGLLGTEVPKAPRVQTALPIVTEEEVLSLFDNEDFFTRVTAVHRIAIRFSFTHRTQIGFVQSYVPLVPVADENGAIADDDRVSRESDDALHIVFSEVGGWTEHDDVTSLRSAEEIAEFVDDDVLLVFECIDHRTSFDLEGRNNERADECNDRHNDDDVQCDIEQVKPETSLW